MKNKHHIISLITLLLLLLWIPTGLDKFWDLQGFRQTLLNQPFPNSWAEVLYLALPIAELGCGLLLVVGSMGNPKTNHLLKWGFALSALLLLGFTLFILFGVLGWYEKRPCGCGSVISGLSWEQHLWFNVGFLLVSLWGWWLVAQARPLRERLEPAADVFKASLPFWVNLEWQGLAAVLYLLSLLLMWSTLRWVARRPLAPMMQYPRKFAPFPGQAGKVK